MAQNTFNLTEEQLVKVNEALQGLYPIPTKSVDITTSAGDVESTVEPLYAEDLHPEVCVKKWIEQQVIRWESKKLKEAMKAQLSSFDLTLTTSATI